MGIGRVLCLGLAMSSIAWAVLGGLGGADLLWTQWLGHPASAIWPLAEGIWAGTTAGKWSMVAVAFTLVPRRTIVGVLVLDLVLESLLWSTAGMLAGLVFVLPTVLVLASTLLAPHRDPAPTAAVVGGRWLLLACGWFVLTGALLVFAFGGPLFGMYREALMGLDAAPPWAAVELAYARIGVGFSVHYVMLALVLRARGPTPAVLRGAALAQLAWFCTDSTTNLVHGAAFNVGMVNLPAMALFGVVWWGTWRASRSVARS